MSKRNLAIEDLFELQSVASPTLSPNGKEIVYLKTHIDEKENKYITNLFHLDLETKETTQWTYDNARVSSPSWSKDGKSIAFLSNRDGKNQLYVLVRNGGEAQQITEFEKGVSSFKWSPCNEKIWFDAIAKEGKTFTDADEKEEHPQPYRTTKMKYQADGVGLLPQDQFKQIGCVELASKEVTRFTEERHHHHLMAVSNCGKKLIVGVNRSENQDREFKLPLIMIDVETKEETVILDQDGHYGNVTFSPDDQWLAFMGSNREFENATHPKLYIYNFEEASLQCLSEAIDAPVGDLVVADMQQSTSGKSIYWTAQNDLYFTLSTMGDVRLYYASLDGAIYPASPEKEHVYDYALSADGMFAIAAISTATNPGELYRLDISTGERVQLTTVNEAFTEEVDLAAPEAIVYKGQKDWDVHGWLMKPVGFEEGEKYPLIVEVHGGPATMYANTFFHEMQVLAAKGYGVLYVNPRGSHGYSQAFVDAVRNDYGGGDYSDIMDGLDYVLAENDWIDTDRLGVTGGSYGGFMTNWIVGHTNRFKAAVTQRSISNWVSFYGVSDIGYYFSEWQHGADMTNVERLWDFSPLKYAKNVETPLLILHSENDLRCPMEQAEQLFITLKSMGKETELVRFPNADHNLSRTGLPNLRIARLTEITDWFERYL